MRKKVVDAIMAEKGFKRLDKGDGWYIDFSLFRLCIIPRTDEDDPEIIRSFTLHTSGLDVNAECVKETIGEFTRMDYVFKVVKTFE